MENSYQQHQQLQQQQQLSSNVVNGRQPIVDENKLLLEQLLFQHQQQQKDISSLNALALAAANSTNLNTNDLLSTTTSSANNSSHQLFFNLGNVVEKSENSASDLLALNIARERNLAINQPQTVEFPSNSNLNQNFNLFQQNLFNNANSVTNNEINQPSTSIASVSIASVVQNKIQAFNLSSRQTSSDRLLTSAESVS